MNPKYSSLPFPSITAREVEKIAAKSLSEFQFATSERSSSNFVPVEGLSRLNDSLNIGSIIRSIAASVILDICAPKSPVNSLLIEPTRFLQMAEKITSGRIAVSKGLLKWREMASETSLVAPSGFLLAWLDAEADAAENAGF